MSEGKESVVTLEPDKNKDSKLPQFIYDSIFDAAKDLEKMYQNIEFYQGEKEEDYTVEGSIISCKYGYNKIRIGIMKDHAIYDNNGNAVLTCGDCMADSNIYNFGLCGSPFLDKNSEKTIIERGAPFAEGEKIAGYKCKMLLAPEWQTGKVHTHIWNADKNKYEAVLPQNGLLICIYGAGVIEIKEINKTKSTATEIVLYTTNSPNLRDKAGGSNIIAAIDTGKLLIADKNSWLNPTKSNNPDGVERDWIKVRYFNKTPEKQTNKWGWVDGWITKEYSAEVSKNVPNKKDLFTYDHSLTEAEMIVNAKYIRKQLIDVYKWKINPIYGLFGNLERESYFSPQFQEVGGKGYGLTQWTLPTKLTDWANNEGLNYKDIDTQLKRIQYEVDNPGEQWITSKHSSKMEFDEYIVSEEPVDYLAEIFLYCYEQAGVTVRDERVLNALKWEEVLNILYS